MDRARPSASALLRRDGPGSIARSGATELCFAGCAGISAHPGDDPSREKGSRPSTEAGLPSLCRRPRPSPVRATDGSAEAGFVDTLLQAILFYTNVYP